MNKIFSVNKTNSDSLSEQYWYIIKAFLSILVVLGHFGQVYLWRINRQLDFVVAPFVVMAYSFHMPCFVFVSGYFSKSLVKRQERAFKDLFIPYLIFNTLFGVFFLLTEHDISTFRNLLTPKYGMWYLIALFVWRLLMPNLVKIKHLLGISFVLYLFGAYFTFDGTLELNRTVGFFIFYLLGYMADEKLILNIRRVPLVVARIALIIEYIVWAIVLQSVREGYILESFTHQLKVDSLKEIIVFVSIYLGTFLLSCVNSILFMAAMPSKTKHVWKIGKDTLPLYVSHLFIVRIFWLFGEHIRTRVYVITAALLSLICIWGLSTEWYRQKFHKFIHKVNSVIFRDDMILKK